MSATQSHTLITTALSLDDHRNAIVTINHEINKLKESLGKLLTSAGTTEEKFQIYKNLCYKHKLIAGKYLILNDSSNAKTSYTTAKKFLSLATNLKKDSLELMQIDEEIHEVLSLIDAIDVEKKEKNSVECIVPKNAKKTEVFTQLFMSFDEYFYELIGKFDSLNLDEIDKNEAQSIITNLTHLFHFDLLNSSLDKKLTYYYVVLCQYYSAFKEWEKLLENANLHISELKEIDKTHYLWSKKYSLLVFAYEFKIAALKALKKKSLEIKDASIQYDALKRMVPTEDLKKERKILSDAKLPSLMLRVGKKDSDLKKQIENAKIFLRIEQAEYKDLDASTLTQAAELIVTVEKEINNANFDTALLFCNEFLKLTEDKNTHKPRFCLPIYLHKVNALLHKKPEPDFEISGELLNTILERASCSQNELYDNLIPKAFFLKGLWFLYQTKKLDPTFKEKKATIAFKKAGFAFLIKGIDYQNELGINPHSELTEKILDEILLYNDEAVADFEEQGMPRNETLNKYDCLVKACSAIQLAEQKKEEKTQIYKEVTYWFRRTLLLDAADNPTGKRYPSVMNSQLFFCLGLARIQSGDTNGHDDTYVALHICNIQRTSIKAEVDPFYKKTNLALLLRFSYSSAILATQIGNHETAQGLLKLLTVPISGIGTKNSLPFKELSTQIKKNLTDNQLQLAIYNLGKVFSPTILPQLSSKDLQLLSKLLLITVNALKDPAFEKKLLDVAFPSPISQSKIEEKKEEPKKELSTGEKINPEQVELKTDDSEKKISIEKKRMRETLRKLRKNAKYAESKLKELELKRLDAEKELHEIKTKRRKNESELSKLINLNKTPPLNSSIEKKLHISSVFSQLSEKRLNAENALNVLAKQSVSASIELKDLAERRDRAEKEEKKAQEKRKIKAPECMAQFALKVALELDSHVVTETKIDVNPFEKHLLENKRIELIIALRKAFSEEILFGPNEEKELAKIFDKLNSLPTYFDFPPIDPKHSILDAMKRMRTAGIEIIFGGGGLLRDFLLQLDLTQIKYDKAEYDVDLIISSGLEHYKLFSLLCSAFPKVHHFSVKETEIGENLYVYTVLDTSTSKKLYQIVDSPYFNLARNTPYKNAPLLFDANHRDQVLNAAYYDQDRRIYTPLASTLIALVCGFIHLIKKDTLCFLRALISHVTLNEKSKTLPFHFSEAFQNFIPEIIYKITIQTFSLRHEQRKEFSLINTLLSTKVFCLPYLTKLRVFKIFTEFGITQILFPWIFKIPKVKLELLLQKHRRMGQIYSEFLIAVNTNDLAQLGLRHVSQNRDFFRELAEIIHRHSVLIEVYFDSYPHKKNILLKKFQKHRINLPPPLSSSTLTFFGSSSSSGSTFHTTNPVPSFPTITTTIKTKTP